jgi:hypothetical protein
MKCQKEPQEVKEILIEQITRYIAMSILFTHVSSLLFFKLKNYIQSIEKFLISFVYKIGF